MLCKISFDNTILHFTDAIAQVVLSFGKCVHYM